MAQSIRDEQALLLLLKCPKKKYIKHLIQYSANLALSHNHVNKSFTTPLIQSFQSDMQLSTEEAHRLLLALSNLIQIAIRINFNFQQNGQNVFSEDFDEQLKGVLIGTVVGMQGEIEQSIGNTMRMGNKLIDVDWQLDLQIANQRGKSNIPNVFIQIQSLNSSNNAELQTDKIQMKGQQFMAFFSNLKKIKQSLHDLVSGQSNQ